MVMTEHSDDKNEHVKNVYAHFGLAMYFAQVLEHGLANAMMSAQLLPQAAGRPVEKKRMGSRIRRFHE